MYFTLTVNVYIILYVNNDTHVQNISSMKAIALIPYTYHAEKFNSK